MDTRMDRRSFLKNAALAGAALVVAPVALGTVEPQAALADEVCTCDVRVNYADHGISEAGGDAYLTNPNTPLNGGYPTSSVPGNATYVEDGDGFLVTVDLVNTMFTLISIDDSSYDAAGASIQSRVEGTTGVITHIKQLSVWVPDEGEYSFTATEHAGYLPYIGGKSWPIRINVSF